MIKSLPSWSLLRLLGASKTLILSHVDPMLSPHILVHLGQNCALLSVRAILPRSLLPTHSGAGSLRRGLRREAVRIYVPLSH